MVHGYIVFYVTDKKEYIVVPLDVVNVTESEFNNILTNPTTTLSIKLYETADAYKAIRAKKHSGEF